MKLLNIRSGYNIRVPRRLLQPGQDSIPLADGSDQVVGSLGVFHYLHCLVNSKSSRTSRAYGDLLTPPRTLFDIRLPV